MPKGFPIGSEMAEKNVNKQTSRQTNRHFRIYISRDMKKGDCDLIFLNVNLNVTVNALSHSNTIILIYIVIHMILEQISNN